MELQKNTAHTLQTNNTDHTSYLPVASLRPADMMYDLCYLFVMYVLYSSVIPYALILPLMTSFSQAVVLLYALDA